MRDLLNGALIHRGGLAPRLACLPAIFVLAFPLAVAGRRIPDKRMAIDTLLLLGVCLIQMLCPTLLGWAVPLLWFTLTAVETIELGLRPGFGFQILPIVIVLLPALFFLVLRPRVGPDERFAPTTALVMALAVVGPLFVV
jgi:hypothetical protein